MNTRLNFRPRPIDVNKPLPIFDYDPEEKRSAFDEDILENDVGAVTERIQEDAIEIPIPIIRTVADEWVTSFQQPHHYIRFRERSLDDEKKRVDYDMDEEDSLWLQGFTKATNLNVTEDEFELIIDRLEKATGFSKEPIELSEFNALPNINSTVLGKVYQYWKQKRLSRVNKDNQKLYPGGKPLLVQFEVPPPIDDLNPLVPFRPREREKIVRKRKNDEESYEKMLMLRKELERVRTLMEVVRKRERLKREYVALSKEILEARLREIDHKQIKRTAIKHNGKLVERKQRIQRQPTIPLLEAEGEEVARQGPGRKKQRDIQKRVVEELIEEIGRIEEEEEGEEEATETESEEEEEEEEEEEGDIETRALVRQILEEEEEPYDFETDLEESVARERRIQINLFKLYEQRASHPIFMFRTRLKKIDDGSAVAAALPARGRYRFGRGGRIVFDRPSNLKLKPLPPQAQPDPKRFRSVVCGRPVTTVSAPTTTSTPTPTTTTTTMNGNGNSTDHHSHDAAPYTEDEVEDDDLFADLECPHRTYFADESAFFLELPPGEGEGGEHTSRRSQGVVASNSSSSHNHKNKGSALR